MEINEDVFKCIHASLLYLLKDIYRMSEDIEEVYRKRMRMLQQVRNSEHFDKDIISKVFANNQSYFGGVEESQWLQPASGIPAFIDLNIILNAGGSLIDIMDDDSRDEAAEWFLGLVIKSIYNDGFLQEVTGRFKDVRPIAIRYLFK